jgi:glucosylceramidase
VPAGKDDYRLRHFSIAHDRKQILPLLRRALALNPKLKVMGTPWSPPAWMKTNQSLVGGRLIDSPRIYDAYARYFVKFVRAYKRAGVPIYALTLQNEPQNRKPNAYPGMDMPVRQEAKLIEALGPKLRRAGLRTKLLGYDHNWKSTPTTSPTRRPARIRRPSTRLTCSTAAPAAGSPAPRSTATPATSSARPSSSIASRRRASGSPSAPARTGPTDPPAQVFSDTLKWHARNIVLGVTRNWGKTVVNWNLALDPTAARTTAAAAPAPACSPSAPGDTFSQNAEYFTLGPPRALRRAGRRADRQHVVRHHRLERADHGRRVPQPRRLDRARRPQRERRSAHVRGRAGRLVVRLHAAGRRARHVRVESTAG